MRTLALEFSSSRRSIALLDEGRVLCCTADGIEPAAGPVSMMSGLLAQAGWDTKAVECVVVGLGPGSYTGIRVAIALAQGIEVGVGVRLLGVSSVECLAWQAWLGGCHGDVAVLVDAQRGELYAARYHINPLGVNLCNQLSILSQAQVQHWADQGAVLLGPDLDRITLPIRPAYPEATMAGVLAADTQAFVPGHELTPIYLRQTQFVKAPPPREVPPLNSSSVVHTAPQPGELSGDCEPPRSGTRRSASLPVPGELSGDPEGL